MDNVVQSKHGLAANRPATNDVFHFQPAGTALDRDLDPLLSSAEAVGMGVIR